MTSRVISKVLGFVLLTALFASAQQAALFGPCADASDATACLPEAPSTVRHSDFFSSSPVLAPMHTPHKLSPAERPYIPLTDRQKFDRFLQSMYSPYTIFNGLYDATWDQATGGKRRYGGGFEGWGDRLGASVAGTASRQFFGTFLLPTLLDQDPRYFAMYHGSVWKRFVHAASRTVLTKGDNGRTQLDVSSFIAISASETLQNTWLPPGDRGFDHTVGRIVGAFQGNATSYVLREFAPDFIRLFKKHSPKALRRVEDRIPERLITGVSPGDD